MSGAAVTVHVRGVARDAVIEAALARLAAEGWVRLEAPARTEPEVRRVVVHQEGGWISLSETEIDDPDPWGKSLSRALGVPVLGVWAWEDEDVVILTVFGKGRRGARLELPRALRRARRGLRRVNVDALVAFIPEVSRDRVKDGLVLGADDVPNELAAYAEELRALGLDAVPDDAHVGGAQVLEAIARLIELPRPLVSPYDPDPEGGDLELEMRPRP